MRAIRIQPRVKRSAERSEARSETLGNLETTVEPAERVTEALLWQHGPASEHRRTVSSAHAVGLPLSSREPRVALANNARSTLGFIRVARIRGLFYLRDPLFQKLGVGKAFLQLDFQSPQVYRGRCKALACFRRAGVPNLRRR